MTPARPTFVLLATTLLAACNPPAAPSAEEPASQDRTVENTQGGAPASPTPSASPAAPIVRSQENDGSPDITPAPLTADAAKTETGARAILLAWARGIELREFDQAWNLMGDAAKGQISKDRFNALFHPLKDIMVAVPNGDMEGAAGSSYYTVPTTVSGTLADGGKAVLKGDVVLRRVNDVDGATPAQLKWHIEQVNLKPA